MQDYAERSGRPRSSRQAIVNRFGIVLSALDDDLERWTQLPLPADVGQAIAIYLRFGRPRCVCRRVFLRHRAPIQGFAHSITVSTIVRPALIRAGIDTVRKGCPSLPPLCRVPDYAASCSTSHSLRGLCLWPCGIVLARPGWRHALLSGRARPHLYSHREIGKPLKPRRLDTVLQSRFAALTSHSEVPKRHASNSSDHSLRTMPHLDLRLLNQPGPCGAFGHFVLIHAA